MKTFYFLLAVMVASTMTACFYKSDKKGKADDVYEAWVIQHNGKTAILTKEQVFHANSKSSENGSMYISGSSHVRFTLYDPASGEISARKVAGNQRSKDAEYLGYDGTQLWFYGMHADWGLHTRDPLTLEIIWDEKTVKEKLGPEVGDLARPEQATIRRFYGWSPKLGSIYISDLQGNYYAIPDTTGKAIRLSFQPRLASVPNPVGSTLEMNNQRVYSLSGDQRNKIHFLYKELPNSPEFVHGLFVIESDVMAIRNHILGQRSDWEKKARALQEQNENATEPYDDAYYTRRNKAGQYESWVKDMDRNLEGLSTSYPLGLDTNVLLVQHATNVTDTATLQFSLFTRVADNSLIQVWTSSVPGIFLYPDRAIEISSFKAVFSSGNPQFRFEWYGKAGNMLVGIKMLHLFALDWQTGKLIFIRRL